MNNILVGNYFSDIDNNYLININVQVNDIVKYWSKCGIIANFGSSYVSLNYPNFKNISNSISYILNELIENAIKYSFSKEDIMKIVIAIENNQVILEVKNTINKRQYELFFPIVENLQNFDDANDKYLKKIGQTSSNVNESGIGLLSIINFFKGQICVKFAENNKNNNFETFLQVKINIEDL